MPMNTSSPYLLPESPCVPVEVLRRLQRDYERFSRAAWPHPVEEYLREAYRLDVSADYAGFPLSNPWGKASGQLSMTPHQVQEDVQAGLGFVVLKTVIAEDESGAQTMKAWAVPAARMSAVQVVGQSGETGWTVDWKGRGWWRPFADYLRLFRDACTAAAETPTLIVPSCKFHLPTTAEETWRVAEYRHTLRRLLQVWQETGGANGTPMPLEKDFSPTLAGSDRAAVQSQILDWLQQVPKLVHETAREMQPESAAPVVRVGLKIFNALFDDAFQVRMLRALHEPPAESAERADFFIYANRLFDPQREYEGQRGIACGGPDLSDRNLRVLSRFQEEAAAGSVRLPLLPFSATGNITSGKMALEYALRGAGSFQLHTYFQLPANQYARPQGSKTEKALHELWFHPQNGFVVWMHHLAGQLGLPADPLRFRDVVGKGPALGGRED